MQHRLEIERSNAKNALEEYMYDIRDKLATIYEEFVNEAEVSSKINKLIFCFCTTTLFSWSFFFLSFLFPSSYNTFFCVSS